MPLNDHPPSLSVQEDRLLPLVDAWLSKMFAPDFVALTAQQVVDADVAANREDPAVTRARATVADCDRRISKYLDGLEAGIPADVIAARIAAAQREKAAAYEVVSTAPPVPGPLAFDEVVETLTTLAKLPDLLKLTSTLGGVQLERVVGGTRYKLYGGSGALPSG